MKQFFRKTNSLLISILIVVIFASGCSSYKNESGASGAKPASKPSPSAETKEFSKSSSTPLENSLKDSNSVAPKADSASPEAPVPTEQAIQETARKIITSGTLEMETLNFEAAVTAISERIKTIGGYIESSSISGKRIEEEGNIQNRSARFVLRIPKQSFEGFATDVGKLGNITNKNTSGQDVTDQYFDTDAHVKSLKIQEDRLLEILKKTGELKDIIELEKELSSVRYQIEKLTGTLRKLDNLVDYSTLTINLREVQEIKTAVKAPISLLEKIGAGFKDSVKSLISFVKELLIVLAVLLPYIVFLYLLYVLLRFVFKLMKKPFPSLNIFKKFTKKKE